MRPMSIHESVMQDLCHDKVKKWLKSLSEDARAAKQERDLRRRIYALDLDVK